MKREPNVSMFNLINCLSEAVDLVSPSLVDHHKQVAYIAHAMATELGMSQNERYQLALAGSLHDIGAISIKERMEALQFELNDPHGHAELGYLMLDLFQPFRRVSEIIRFHHVPWMGGRGQEFRGREVPFRSHILHLADRISVLINKQKEILSQVDEITHLIKAKKGTMFAPDVVAAFLGLAEKEYFWLDAASSSLGTVLRNRLSFQAVRLGMSDILDFTQMFRRVIDFRIRFTATHSSGVAASADLLAKLCGFSDREREMMLVAAHLHDLGKLAVPTEILEKPGRLTTEEFRVIKGHTYYTYRILEHIEDFHTIGTWAAFHHERLDGSGYPFHLGDGDLSLGSRVMAVADVFTAISESRPYRVGMSGVEVLRVLRNMVNSGALDGNIVSMVETHFEDIRGAREQAELASHQEYEDFVSRMTSSVSV